MGSFVYHPLHSSVGHGDMRYATICIGILFCLLFQQDIVADTLYTWIAPEGTIHISKTKPPNHATLKEQLQYPTQKSALATPTPEMSAPETMGDDMVLVATQQAKEARKQAQAVRQLAEKAIDKANRVKQEAETFLEPWRNKRRIRKPMQLQIESRIQNTNQVIAEAERLIAEANEAEQKAQLAELKARNIQAQFLEAYRTIVSQ
jgi:hypothetical protein